MRITCTTASLLLTCGLTAPAAFAHERGNTQNHDHTHNQAQPVIPRDADRHTTGTLPRSQGQNTDARPIVHWSTSNHHRRVTANGLPDHEPGRFPNRGNPNVVAEQQYTFQLPLDPPPPNHPVHVAADVHRDNGFIFGIALNGVVFEPATGLNWTPTGLQRGGRPQGWTHEAIGGNTDFGIDHANAHVQRTGAYHYHGIPTPLMPTDQPTHPTLLGYAADGYPIYGPLGHQDPADPDSPLIRLASSWQLKT